MTTPLTFDALGTKWWIELFDENIHQRRDGLSVTDTALVYSIEDRFSRFKSTSLVSRLNSERVLSTNDADFFLLIQLGQTLYKDTDSVFNCLLGAHLEARGYDATYSFTPTAYPISIPNPLTDIICSTDTIVLRNGKLDVGGFGKGWAIDQVAALLNNEGMKEYLINAGGDMYGTSERGQPITIYLEHPTTPNWYLEQTTLFHQGFAASTRTKRQWRHHNQTYSHIIDTTPTHLVSPDYDTGVFIKASQTVMADAFATTGLLIPPDTLFALATIHELGVAIYQPSTQSLQPNLAFTKNSHDVS